jgi:predicted PhzF superfamily epimerase YddE/YHI9
VPTWEDGELVWIRARAEWAPQMALRQYASPDEVEALEGPPDDLGFVDCWAWVDEAAGVLRSRVFAGDAGVPEDEATGSAALRMVALLGREIEIHQGQGSLLLARPGPEDTIEVGGHVRDRGRHDYAD